MPEVPSSVAVPEVNPEESIVETAEEIQEGALDEDSGFDVVENITPDVYLQQHQQCKAKKL